MEAYCALMKQLGKDFTLEWVNAGHSSDDKQVTEQQQLMRMQFAVEVRSCFLVFVPTIREIRDFYREMYRTNRESVTMYQVLRIIRGELPGNETGAGKAKARM
eukprot:SAG31_NODE_1022_length_10309_cov_9.623874_5_plen_103_part_00